MWYNKAMERKKLPKTALPRIYKIDEMIASGRYPSTKELAKAYEASMSSISRDIEFMRDSLGAPIEYDARRRGYYYAEKTFRLPGSFTTAENIQALGMAKTLLTLYRDTPLYTAAQNLLESITAPLIDKQDPDLYQNRIVVPPVAAAALDPAVWDVITAGLKENKIIAFHYRGIQDDDFKPRRVRPYQLLFDNGVWSLYGYAEERKAMRLFLLSRIRDAAVTESGFSLPGDYDYCSRSDGSNFGVFEGNTRYRFCIDFFEPAAFGVSERTWATDQAVTEIEGGIRIKFTSTQYDKVLEWVLSKGCYAIPVKPEKLVEEWNWHNNETRKMKKKTGGFS
jgi:predicted DNA-binding transcriptional regulator YafY